MSAWQLHPGFPMPTRRVRIGAAAIFCIATFTAQAQTQSADSPDGKNYIQTSFSPQAIGAAGVGAAITQGTNTPSDWGQGAEGFGKRFGSAIAKHLVKRAIQYPVAKFFHEELSYRRSDKTGFGPRLEYALVSTVYTHKTTDGSRTVAKGEIVGAFGSGLLSRMWQPASTRTIALGFGSGAITLGADAAGNVLREFWPEIRHPHTHGVSENKTGSPGAKAAFPSATLANPEQPETQR
jgi:hypothetical protein